ncbi:CocE/NonD family hydrolase [Mesorhizobium sp. B2-3-3]|nr:CocE/NonD family hydrolase [Mesorhizobium sp. B2-3-3]
MRQGLCRAQSNARGAGYSEGDITYWCRQLAEDGYDFIEWAARQPWCSGKVGMSGNSWLAVSQWFIAAERPPSLAAIAPWEGFTDHFRQTGNRGGIPAPSFPEAIIVTLAGKNRVEDQPLMIQREQLITPYWQDKAARLEHIEILAYVVASYTNSAHTFGSFGGFRRLSSKAKWLRVNNTNEWLDYYTPKYAAELLAFFDRYLRGIDNGWENTPAVRICVLDPGGEDVVDRVAPAWPVPAKSEALHLTADKRLTTKPAGAAGQLSYAVGPEAKLEFTHVAAEPAELIGYMKLKLWVEADGADDMELAVTVEKRAADRLVAMASLGEGAHGAITANGLLRVYQRALDPKLGFLIRSCHARNDVGFMSRTEARRRLRPATIIGLASRGSPESHPSPIAGNIVVSLARA